MSEPESPPQTTPRSYDTVGEWLLEGLRLLGCLCLIPLFAVLLGFVGWGISRDMCHGIPFGVTFGLIGILFGYTVASAAAARGYDR